MRRRAVIVIAIVLTPLIARADDLSQLSGRVIDENTGDPVEGAQVYISGPQGLEVVVTTDRLGRYSAEVPRTPHTAIFVYGKSRTSGRVVVDDDRETLDGKVDATSGEVIEIQERPPPPVPPKAKNYKPHKAPPYSDAAVLSDAWTRAWMLLDVDETGRVVRFKFLKRPGYDLEEIAKKEVFALQFDPARDENGKAIRVWILWTIEWPSAWWLSQFVGTRAGMPPMVYYPPPPHRLDWKVPCRGSGPLNLGSIHPAYKDCSKPDLSKIKVESWVVPEN
jgi:hypothetical protein